MSDVLNLIAALTAFAAAAITYTSFKVTDAQARALMATINVQIESVRSANENSARALERTQYLMEQLIDRLPGPRTR